MKKNEIILEKIDKQYGSIAEFSRATGIPDSSIRNLNKAGRGIENMRVITAIQICRALNLDIEDLIDDNFSIRPNPQKIIVSDDEKKIILKYREMSQGEKEMLMRTAGVAAENEKSELSVG